MVNVLLKQNNAATVLRVNKTAIQQIDGKNVVFVAKQEKDKIHFAPVAVELGIILQMHNGSRLNLELPKSSNM